MRVSKAFPAWSALSLSLLALLAGCPAPSLGEKESVGGWHSLFDGRSISGWEKVDFGGEGQASIADGKLLLPMGEPMTGVRWRGEFPRVDYEIALQAMRADGSDFFCGLTFPLKDSSASLILGGWGGSVCGISSLDSFDASENETTSYRTFENGKWYPVRLRVSQDKIEAWLGEEKIVDVPTAGRKIGVRSEIAPCRPLGLATWRTTAALRDIRWRRLKTAG